MVESVRRSSGRPGASSAALERLVRRQVDAVNHRDLDRLMALYAEDAVLEFPASPRITGRPAIRRAYARYFSDWEEKVVLHRVVVSGQTVTAEGTAQGRHRAVQLKLPGHVPVPLSAYHHAFTVIWKIRGGKIRRHRVSYDADDLVRQLLEP